jgi:hypothetical protein
MGDSHEFYVFFYTYIDNMISQFVVKDNNIHFLKSKEEQKKYILTNLFSPKNHTDHYLTNMIGNHLNVYLNMIHFIKEKDQPFMPVLIDFTQLNYVFNRFLYHYAKLCMNNECIFSENIHIHFLKIPIQNN